MRNVDGGAISREQKTEETHEHPIFISIGSFLIDAFDTPPRPIVDSTPLPHHPSFRITPPVTNSVAPPTPPSPTKTNSGSISTSTSTVNNLHTAPTLSKPHFPIVSYPSSSRLNTPIATPNGSGSSTPQLHFDDAPPPDQQYEYLGGGALYALIGARLFLPPKVLKTLVDRAVGGADLREELVKQAKQFGEMWIWNEGPKTKMSRARIRYEGDNRLFHATVKPPHRTLTELLLTPLQGGQYMHVAPPFSAENLATLQTEIRRLSDEGTVGAWKPKLIFEPTPPSCHTGQRMWLEKITPGIHVLSPNHEELLSFYGHKINYTDPALIPTLEGVMHHLLHNVGVGENGRGILAVRCGRLGGCIGTKEGGLRWFPAYWGGSDEHKVKDVTGAGNAFIGGYVAGLSLTNEHAYQAALYGTVAASFVVEQIGLPSISMSVASGQTTEYWNGDLPRARIELLRQKWTEAGIL